MQRAEDRFAGVDEPVKEAAFDSRVHRVGVGKFGHVQVGERALPLHAVAGDGGDAGDTRRTVVTLRRESGVAR